MICNKNQKKNIYLDLDIDENRVEFSTSIDDAISKAETDLVKLNETIESVKNLRSNCDRIDYALAASSGLLCGIIDLFLVGKPGESPLGEITDNWFANRVIDFTNLLRHFTSKTNEVKKFERLDQALRYLEKLFKVPYDQTGVGDAGKEVFGLNAKNHHFKNLAHNPSIMGLFFSILDQFTNSSHFVTDGQLICLENADGEWELRGRSIITKFFCGIANWIGHLISDVSGSQSSAKKGNRGMGIPSPFWTWTNDIIVIKTKLGLEVTEFDKALNDLALNIFEQGYDTRFQATQAIPVVVNELTVRLLYSIRRLFKYYSDTNREDRSFKVMWQKCKPFSNPTITRMLTVAHGTFCLIDMGDAVGRGYATGAGAFNVVEFVLRLNIVGVGRFTIALYGEAKMAFAYRQRLKEANMADRQIIILDNYIKGLKILQKKYNDKLLLTFLDDFQDSVAYKDAFKKSAELAELREVNKNRVLKDKNDIDRYFGGK